MATEAVCTTSFNQGGYGAQVGDVVATTSWLYIKYPTKFAIQDETYPAGVGPVLTSAGGSVYRLTVNNGGTVVTEAVV